MLTAAKMKERENLCIGEFLKNESRVTKERSGVLAEGPSLEGNPGCVTFSKKHPG